MLETIYHWAANESSLLESVPESGNKLFLQLSMGVDQI